MKEIPRKRITVTSSLMNYPIISWEAWGGGVMRRDALLCPQLFTKVFEQIFKGAVSLDFLLQIFSWIIFPQSPENKIWVISNIFQNLAVIFGSQGAPTVSTTLAANLPLVSFTPVANLPLVPMTATVNFVTGTAGVVDTGGNRCQWTAYTFKWFGRKKFIFMLTLYP